MPVSPVPRSCPQVAREAGRKGGMASHRRKEERAPTSTPGGNNANVAPIATNDDLR